MRLSINMIKFPFRSDQLVFFSLLIPFTIFCTKNQQSTCTDPFALNYNPTEPVNAKCQYLAELKTPNLICDLNNRVKETSGLVFTNGLILTHNDKGGLNQLYAIDPNNCNISTTYTIENATNTDWEELSQSDTHIYVGDFGNNDGDRRDLKIYKIAKHQLLPAVDKSIGVESVIEFNYPEQQSFTPSNKHNFDCEAMVIIGNQIFLFTKNRSNAFTYLYKVPDLPGQHQAILLDSFEVEVMITGAALNSDNTQLALLGYQKSSTCVIWLFDGFENEFFFKGQKKKIIMGSFSQLGQMEGIEYKNDNTLFISSEKTDDLLARFYEMGIE
jgi:hypothetical protein